MALPILDTTPSHAAPNPSSWPDLHTAAAMKNGAKCRMRGLVTRLSVATSCDMRAATAVNVASCRRVAALASREHQSANNTNVIAPSAYVLKKRTTAGASLLLRFGNGVAVCGSSATSGSGVGSGAGALVSGSDATETAAAASCSMSFWPCASSSAVNPRPAACVSASDGWSGCLSFTFDSVLVFVAVFAFGLVFGLAFDLRPGFEADLGEPLGFSAG